MMSIYSCGRRSNSNRSRRQNRSWFLYSSVILPVIVLVQVHVLLLLHHVQAFGVRPPLCSTTPAVSLSYQQQYYYPPTLRTVVRHNAVTEDDDALEDSIPEINNNNNKNTIHPNSPVVNPFSFVDEDNGSTSTSTYSCSMRSRRQLLQAMLVASSSATAIAASSAQAISTADTLPVSPPEERAAQELMLDWSKIQVMKPPTDDREYKVEVFPQNQLRVVLCSDPTSNEAGCAMNVHVGATSDPMEIPGLAHFNEHMLFLGTQPYPEENSFADFLALNGGSSNAYTASEQTCYYFTLQDTDAAEATINGSSSKFQEGLQRFGSFFTSPLFSASATGRELNAIESENVKNLQTDSFRLYQLQKSRQNSEHPHAKFFTGNKQTLLIDSQQKYGKNLRQALLDFYTKYYTADQMTVAIVGPQSLTTLRDMAVTAFADIPNRNTDGPNGTRTTGIGGPPEQAWKRIIPPYLPTTHPGAATVATPTGSSSSVIPSFGTIVKVVPVQDLRSVSISWPVVYSNEHDHLTALLTKQSQYVGHILGHEGPGSMLSSLKQQGYVNALSAGSDSDLSDYETFELTLSLTRTGFDHVLEVLETVFATLAMLRSDTTPVPEYIFNEVLQLEELSWRFSSKGGVGSYVQSLATSLYDYPPSLVVAGPRRLALALKENTNSNKNNNNNNTNKDDATIPVLLESNVPRTKYETSSDQLQYTKQLYNNFIRDNLSVDNAMFTILSKSYKGQTTRQEKWYGTEYRVDPVPYTTLLKWKMLEPTDASQQFGITYPKKNRFIPTEKGLALKFPQSNPQPQPRPRTFEERMVPIPPPKIIRDDTTRSSNTSSTTRTGRWTVYYKPDTTFGQPKAFVIFELLTKNVYSSAKSAALSNMYEFCVGDKLGEYAYDAGLAGLSYNVQIVPRGVRSWFQIYK